MSETIRCDIVSAQELIFSGDVSHVVASGANGELGIYPRHAPLMTTLKPGSVRLVLPAPLGPAYHSSRPVSPNRTQPS